MICPLLYYEMTCKTHTSTPNLQNCQPFIVQLNIIESTQRMQPQNHMTSHPNHHPSKSSSTKISQLLSSAPHSAVHPSNTPVEMILTVPTTSNSLMPSKKLIPSVVRTEKLPIDVNVPPKSHVRKEQPKSST